ncbi:hypothetical protein [Nostoc sp.]
MNNRLLLSTIAIAMVAVAWWQWSARLLGVSVVDLDWQLADDDGFAASPAIAPNYQRGYQVSGVRRGGIGQRGYWALAWCSGLDCLLTQANDDRFAASPSRVRSPTERESISDVAGNFPR